jgi:hypothetical protein
MKTMCLLFLSISWAALTSVRGYAVPSNPVSQQTSPESSANTASDQRGLDEHAAPAHEGNHQGGGKSSDERRAYGWASGPNRLPSRATRPKANRPQQLPKSRPRFIPENALKQPGFDKSKVARIGGFIPNRTIHNTLPVRMSSVARPAVPLLNDAHHRGPNPAVVAGSMNSNRRNTGAINGTRMNRKP